jgi:hypothetical protein
MLYLRNVEVSHYSVVRSAEGYKIDVRNEVMSRINTVKLKDVW